MKIKSLQVKGYRSLKDVELTDLGDVTVIYGDNNTGKSNILAFLEVVFKPKIVETSAASSDPIVSLERVAQRERAMGIDEPLPPESKQGSWMRGDIPDFSDNFFQNKADTITFAVTIELAAAEVDQILGDEPELRRAIDTSGPVTVSGVISKATGQSACMAVHQIVWGAHTIVYEETDGKPSYPGLRNVPQELRDTPRAGLEVFLDDSVVVIGSHRFLEPEKEDPSSALEFGERNFKNTLFELFLSRGRYDDFAEIAEWFSNPPFDYGTLSFARTTGDSLEVMVEKDGLRIPVDRLGSGVQQALVIISHLVANKKKKVFGLEEPEINLSPKTQQALFHELLELTRGVGKHVHQLLITSHSEVFGEQKLARVIHVDRVDGETVVTPREETSARLQEQFKWTKVVEFCDTCDIEETIDGVDAAHVCNDCRSLHPQTQEEFGAFRAGIAAEYASQ